jgi:hypothetical protein
MMVSYEQVRQVFRHGSLMIELLAVVVLVDCLDSKQIPAEELSGRGCVKKLVGKIARV